MQVFDNNRFTKYERARMIGSRALQIAMGAPFLIELSEKQIVEMRYNPISIAKLEFEKGVIPLTITRPLPKAITESGSIEEINKLGKKLIKDIQDTEEEQQVETEIPVEEIMKDMNVESDDD